VKKCRKEHPTKDKIRRAVRGIGEPLGKGTNHGSPYAYDREVMVLAWGKGVPRLRSSEPVDQLRVAATLARLLGISAPAQAVPQPLF
jgi:hypothetical protein